ALADLPADAHGTHPTEREILELSCARRAASIPVGVPRPACSCRRPGRRRGGPRAGHAARCLSAVLLPDAPGGLRRLVVTAPARCAAARRPAPAPVPAPVPGEIRDPGGLGLRGGDRGLCRSTTPRRL